MPCPNCKMMTYCLCTTVLGPYGREITSGTPLQTSPGKLLPSSPMPTTPTSPFYEAPTVKKK